MGAWGPGLYQNDTSEDVKSYYIDQLHRGKTSEQITNEIVADYQEALLDSQERMDIWCALADTQWEKGRLIPYVKEQAIACLTQQDILLDWKNAPKKIASKRKQVLEKLLQKLNTPQPPEKKISQYKLYKCPWHIGDIFSLSMDCTNDMTCWPVKKHLLIEIADYRTCHPDHIVPIVYLKIAENTDTSLSVEDYNKIPYLKTDKYQVERDILLGLKQVYGEHDSIDYLLNCMDEQDAVTEYRISLITTSARVIPKSLQFVGNFKDIVHPSQEYIPGEKLNISVTDWKSLVDKAIALFKRYGV